MGFENCLPVQPSEDMHMQVRGAADETTKRFINEVNTGSPDAIRLNPNTDKGDLNRNNAGLPNLSWSNDGEHVTGDSLPDRWQRKADVLNGDMLPERLEWKGSPLNGDMMPEHLEWKGRPLNGDLLPERREAREDNMPGYRSPSWMEDKEDNMPGYRSPSWMEGKEDNMQGYKVRDYLDETPAKIEPGIGMSNMPESEKDKVKFPVTSYGIQSGVILPSIDDIRKFINSF